LLTILFNVREEVVMRYLPSINPDLQNSGPF